MTWHRVAPGCFVAAGSAFGPTAALMKGMATTFADGIGNLLTSWQIYGMIAAGVLGMFLVQSATNAAGCSPRNRV